MKTLHLNLIRCWFDMVRNSEKLEEYREISIYWCSNFLLFEGKHQNRKWWQDTLNRAQLNTALERPEIIEKLIKEGTVTFKSFDKITFSNGYSKMRDQFDIELKNIEIKEGKKDWGATDGKKYFTISLGDVLNYTLFSKPKWTIDH